MAHDFQEFAAHTARFMSEPELLSAMRVAAREQALRSSWDRSFQGMYEAYGSCLSSVFVASHSVFDVATT